MSESVAETGRRFGVSRSRVDQILHAHFCISTLPATPQDEEHRKASP